MFLSNVDFFDKGNNRSFFKLAGIVAVSRETFTIAVMMVMKLVKQFFSQVLGFGFWWQVVDFDDEMTLATSSLSALSSSEWFESEISFLIFLFSLRNSCWIFWHIQLYHYAVVESWEILQMFVSPQLWTTIWNLKMQLQFVLNNGIFFLDWTKNSDFESRYLYAQWVWFCAIFAVSICIFCRFTERVIITWCMGWSVITHPFFWSMQI